MLKTNDQDASIAPIKYFIFKVASLKYLYITLLVLCLAVAVLFNKYSSRVYEASATLSPVENKTSSILSSNQLFGGLNPLQTIDNIENDISNLSSFALAYSTVTKMNLEVSYFREQQKFLKQTHEIYGNLPFTIAIDKSHIQPINAKIYITVLDESTYRITISEKEVSLYNYVDNVIVSDDYELEADTVCKFSETIQNNAFKFSVTYNKDYFLNPASKKFKYFIQFNHMDYLAKGYLRSLDIQRISPLASIINIKFTENNLEKTIKFLNNYLNSFLDDNLSKKNKIAFSTVNFIDSQISEISDSLNISEVLAKLLILRDIKSFSEAKSFFRPTLESLHDPYLMNGMEAASKRLILALTENHPICIYGDYDVDGTCSTALLYMFLKELGATVDFYIPQRLTEGYGLSKESIDVIKSTASGSSSITTVISLCFMRVSEFGSQLLFLLVRLLYS